jgi:hypothetical protein
MSSKDQKQRHTVFSGGGENEWGISHTNLFSIEYFIE